MASSGKNPVKPKPPKKPTKLNNYGKVVKQGKKLAVKSFKQDKKIVKNNPIVTAVKPTTVVDAAWIKKYNKLWSQQERKKK
jgi:hypothetical protein